ncbi:hypothetical protein [Streptomyces coryli]|uniref:hypothetical protein n=1 Tax=Streptomyces coryli TaxID=1128680 RepID=UPI0030B8F3BB
MKLLLLLASFALTAYAGIRMLDGDWFLIALWVVGAAVAHDLLLIPLYAALDRGAQRVLGPGLINYVRVPAFLSGLLLLVFAPLILRGSAGYEPATLKSPDVFLGRWLLLTGVLFALSALVYAVRRSTGRPRSTSPER